MTFLRYFPDVSSLAAAPEDVLLKVWQGLGYYTRALNMKKAAISIVEDHHGVFPEKYEEIRALPGVGDYTAAAVSSIAFNAPYAAVDGNVKRVIARLNGITEIVDKPEIARSIKEWVELEIVHHSPGELNQALMELGATVCIPIGPKCSDCPMNEVCIAVKLGITGEIPKRMKKKVPEKIFTEYYFFTHKQSIWLMKRENSGIWKGLYECFNRNTRELTSLPDPDLISESAEVTGYKDYVHKLTHRTIFARFWIISGLPSNIVRETPGIQMIPLADVGNYPVHRLMQRYLHDSGFLDKAEKYD